MINMHAFPAMDYASHPVTNEGARPVWVAIGDLDTIRIFSREDGLFSCFQSFAASVFSDEGVAPGEKRLAHASMVKDAAMWLDTSHQEFSELVIIAPPTILDEMKRMIGQQAGAKIVAEIARSMSEKSEIELAAELPRLVAETQSGSN